jgi:hypothetical protein
MANNFNSFDKKLLAVATALFVLFTYLVSNENLFGEATGVRGELIGEVQESKNDVRTKTSGDFRYKTLDISEIHLGDSVFTGASSTLDLRLRDGSLLHLSENTLITFSKVGSKMVLNLQSGQATTDSKSIEIIKSVSTSALNEQTQKRTKAKREPKVPSSAKPSEDLANLAPPPPPPTPAQPPPSVERIPKISRPKPFETEIISSFRDGSPVRPSTVSIAWEHPKVPANFELQISSDSNFKKIEYAQSTERQDLETPILNYGTHYVRVREVGQPWSSTASVELKLGPPLQSVLLAAPEPIPAEQKHAITPKQDPLILRWSAVLGAQKYLLELDKNPSFDRAKKIFTTTTQYSIEKPNPGMIFYRVTAISEKAELSQVSRPGKMTSYVAPPLQKDVPEVKYLAKDEKDSGPAQEFKIQWTKTPFTDSYRVTVSDNPEFKNPKEFVTPQNQYSFLAPKTGKYYWKVQSLNSQQNALNKSDVASEIKYSLLAPLAAPVPIAPLSNITLFFQSKLSTPFYFAWKPVQNAKEYRLQVASDSSFEKIIFDTRLKDTKLVMPKKIEPGQVHWRVQAIMEDRLSSWSVERPIQVFSGKTAKGD